MRRSTPSANTCVAIKGPLTTPIGGGFRSLNVSLRQKLDLFACVRPVRHFEGVPSPVLAPDKVDMIIFRENTEDVYAGLELEEGQRRRQEVHRVRQTEFGWDIRPDSGIGFKPISKSGTKRIVRAAINHAVKHGRKSVTLVHKGNIMKYTEGAFRKWGYELVREEFSDVAVGWDDCGGKPGDKILVKDTHRRHFPAADPDAARGVRRGRDHEPQRRLHERRAGGPGRRHRHRARRQHQLRNRRRHFRSHPRHGARNTPTWTRSTPAA